MKIPKIKPPEECQSGNARQIDMRDLKKGIIKWAEEAGQYALKQIQNKG